MDKARLPTVGVPLSIMDEEVPLREQIQSQSALPRDKLEFSVLCINDCCVFIIFPFSSECSHPHPALHCIFCGSWGAGNLSLKSHLMERRVHHQKYRTLKRLQ